MARFTKKVLQDKLDELNELLDPFEDTQTYYDGQHNRYTRNAYELVHSTVGYQLIPIAKEPNLEVSGARSAKDMFVFMSGVIVGIKEMTRWAK
jgi:hypothetical protein